MSDEPRLEEKALSKAAETQLSNHLQAAKELDVEIRTDLIKMTQGQADSVSVAGKELVTQQDLRIQEVELHTSPVAINPLSALFGKIELNQSVDSTARIVVTEADVNQNLNSNYVLSKLSPWELNVEGRIVLLTMQPPMQLHLPGEGKLVFSSNMQVTESGETQQVRFTAVMYPRTHERSVLMEAFSFEEGQAVSLEVVVAFIKTLKELVDLPYLEYDGTTFRIKEMEVQKGSVTLQVEAHLNQLPSL